jgi:hypothetical protein
VAGAIQIGHLDYQVVEEFGLSHRLGMPGHAGSNPAYLTIIGLNGAFSSPGRAPACEAGWQGSRPDGTLIDA